MGKKQKRGLGAVGDWGKGLAGLGSGALGSVGDWGKGLAGLGSGALGSVGDWGKGLAGLGSGALGSVGDWGKRAGRSIGIADRQDHEVVSVMDDSSGSLDAGLGLGSGFERSSIATSPSTWGGVKPMESIGPGQPSRGWGDGVMGLLHQVDEDRVPRPPEGFEDGLEIEDGPEPSADSVGSDDEGLPIVSDVSPIEEEMGYFDEDFFGDREVDWSGYPNSD